MASTALIFGKPKGSGTSPVNLVFGGAPAPPATGGIKAFNGTAWVTATVKRWNGSAWVAAAIKRYDGSAWQNI